MVRLYFLLPAAMSLLALLDMPYGYYQLLRLVVALTGAFIAFAAWRMGEHVAVIAFGLLALIYNPAAPLHLGREVWKWVNIGTAVAFLATLGIIEISARRSRARRGVSNQLPGPRSAG